MADTNDPQRIGLSEAISGLRAELSRARRESQGQDIRFDVDKIEVELSIDFGMEREVHGGFKLFSFVDVGGKAGNSKKTGHTVKLSLSVHADGKETAPFVVSDPTGPAPALKPDRRRE